MINHKNTEGTKINFLKIEDGLSQRERLIRLNESAKRQN